MKRGLIAVVVTMVLYLGLSSFDSLAITQNEAVEWVKAQKTQASHYDIDGNGLWCTDLATAYMNYLWLSVNGQWNDPWGLYPYTTRMAKDYDQYVSGNVNWTVLDRTSSTIPQPGDIFVSEQDTRRAGTGHVGIIIMPYGTTGAKVIEMSAGQKPTENDITWGSQASYNADHLIRFNFFDANGTQVTSITPSVNFSPWDNSNYTYIWETDASIGQQIDVYNGTCTETGMNLYDEDGNFLSGAGGLYYYRVYFKINEELGVTLTPGTTYKYNFYAKVNGETYYSNEGSFTTLGSKPDYSNIVETTSDSTYTDYQSYEPQETSWETQDDNSSYVNETEAQSYDTTETLAENSYDNYEESYEEQETEAAKAEPTVKFSAWENGNYTYIRDTDASIGQQIDVYDGECTEAGMYLYDKDGKELGSSGGEYYYRVYFKINEELGVQLEPGTKYKYKFYAIVNGDTYWGKEGSFKTKEDANTPTVNFSKWENGNYTYIRETDASIGQQIDVYDGECTEAGMYLYDKDGNELGSSGGEYYYRVYFKINEELGVELESGTKYKYKFYAVVNGKTYWGNEGSFKTKG